MLTDNIFDNNHSGCLISLQECLITSVVVSSFMRSRRINKIHTTREKGYLRQYGKFNTPNAFYVTRNHSGCTVYSCFMPGSLER